MVKKETDGRGELVDNWPVIAVYTGIFSVYFLMLWEQIKEMDQYLQQMLIESNQLKIKKYQLRKIKNQTLGRCFRKTGRPEFFFL